MPDRVRVAWRGREYEAVRREGREAAPEPGPVWQLVHEGAMLTSFPAEPRDGPGAVQDKVLAWLEANESRPTQDVGRQ